MHNSLEHILTFLPHYLPLNLFSLCKHYLNVYNDICEIRLRKDKNVSFTIASGCLLSDYVCDAPLFDSCVSLMLNGSAYKHSEAIARGVIPLEHGFRVGIAGSAITNNGKIENVYDITSLNIRLPRQCGGFAAPLIEYLLTLPLCARSTLVISPPSGGKTTFLRDFAVTISSPPVSERVCVVDTRFELAPLQDVTTAQLDILSGYPLELGIDTATRYLNPEYIVCDEIDNRCDLIALKNASHSGIPFISSTHASSIEELILKPELQSLLENGIFRTIVRLSRSEKGIIPVITPWRKSLLNHDY